MSRILRGIDRSKRIGTERSSARISRSFVVLSILLVACEVHAGPMLRIAVAPFAGERSGASVAEALTDRLALRGLDRLIAPGDFVATTVFEPRAADIRRWAHNSAVDTIVVGRVVSLSKDGDVGAQVVETVVRSGHSGAELSRHDVVLQSDGDLDRSAETLAVAILGGLGHVEQPSEELGTEIPAAAVSANDVAGEGLDGDGSPSSDSSAGGLESELFRSGFRSDAPIEIKADEAEIINRDEGRELIFQRNVWVRKANVTLRSDRLEASYRKGESEPRELIAEGNVLIVQDDRSAKCARAIYLREENRLTCRGRAELVQGCDIVRGESIEFDLAGDWARVQGAASIVIQPKEGASSECATRRGKM